MSHYVIELIIWMLVAFFIGCLIGWLLRSLFGRAEEPALAYTPPSPVAKATESLVPPITPVTPVPPVTPIAPVPPNPIEAEILAPVPVSAVPGLVRMERPKGIDAARGGKPDNLQIIAGVGAKNEQVLHNLGFYHFDQIASWTPQQVAWVDDHLKFGGRIEREDWIAQAKLLAAGNWAEFRRRFGTGGLTETEFEAAMGKDEEGSPSAAGPAVAALSSLPPSVSSAPAAANAPAAGAPVAAPASASARAERPSGIAAARGGKPDNLQMISGVGSQNEEILHKLGIYHFDQIAGWMPQQVDWVDDHLKFGGRIAREEWIAQARLLADGKFAEFRRRFETGGMSEAEFAKAAGRGGAVAAVVAAPAAVAPAAPPAVPESAASRNGQPKGIAAARGGKADNLQRISGVGPKNEKILHTLGIFHFDQIAVWSAKEIAWVDDHLKFNGRIAREEWIAQCKLLAAGKDEEFAKRWGAGGLKPAKK